MHCPSTPATDGNVMNIFPESTNNAALESIQVSPNVAYSPLTLTAKNDAVVYKEEFQPQFNMGNSDKRRYTTTNEVCEQPYYEEVSTQGKLTKVGTEEKEELQRKQFPRSQSPEYMEITIRGKHLTRERAEYVDEKKHYNNLGTTIGENAPCTGEVEYSSPHGHHLVQSINNHSRLATVREDN